MNAHWEVPEHTVAEFAPRRHRHALVVPVINEGERIRAQLLRTAAEDLPVDVVIADGGSTDHSLDPSFLREAGVRALLTKTGPGKLSAQLRMAYAWCLQQGYEGIVTIDGNGKDNVEAVRQFVARLDEGYDYVQGSRYRPGGKAENTPLERTIGNRLIHAPLLSLAGRHRFTDTTNGFRGYSARYLLDERVQPFRHAFAAYALLFYLTVRAGQLGFRVCEVPVTRSYPADGKVPTKIAGRSAQLRLLGETVNAATGAYSPPGLATGPQRAIGRLLGGLAVLLLGWLFFAGRNSLQFTPDSWTFVELAKSIPVDFFRTHHVRQFHLVSPYSASFPPLWPMLLFLFDRLTHAGPAGGFPLALIASGLFLATSEAAGRLALKVRWVGLAAALLVLPHAGFVEELIGARSIPLQMMLYAAVLWALAERRALLVGLLTGAAVMNRFDALPFALGIVILTPWLMRGRRLAGLLACLTGLVLALSPWIAYSRSHFGRWFATDNGGTALSADPQAFVTDWWPGPQTTLFDAPGAWLAKVLGNLGKLFPSVLASPGPAAMLAILATIAALLVAGRLLLATGPGASREIRGTSGLLPGFLLCIAANLAANVLTGYLDSRYFVPLIWVLLLIGLGQLCNRMASIDQRHTAGGFAAALALATSALAMAATFRAIPVQAHLVESPGDAAVLNCLASADEPILLVKDATTAARWSAVRGWNTVVLPGNFDRLDPGQARQFALLNRVTHVHAETAEQLAQLGEKLPLQPTPACSAPLAALARAGQ